MKLNATKSARKQLDNIQQQLYETGLHIALDMKHGLSNEWYMLKKTGEVDLRIDTTRLPYMAQAMHAVKIEQVLF